MSITGIILAAGASRRMGTPKALLAYRGETWLDRWIGLLGRHCDPVLVVLGAEAESIRSGIRRLDEALFVCNPAPERGQFSSLQCALTVLPERAEGFLFAPVDHPAVRPETVAQLVADFARGGALVVAPRYRGRGGHPVCCARLLAAEMLVEPPESQARLVLRRHLHATRYVDVDDPGVAEDVDDQDSYRRLLVNGP
ncbi:MAG: nucleotidyltransferase family protein [Bryobacterales bacterium]|nr:nucleotidyltransferase family protein [Bryobacteraceae bacterium]MDW8131340.1 nucleotidyltransferase family protein [Bryobacterales bacterium]